jgi:superfamily I DNA/RNA helicase
MPNTEEQDAILTLAKSSKSNLMISALAGTGKSTTLLATERATKKEYKTALYLVFNAENAAKIMSLDQLKKEKKPIDPRHSDDPATRVLSTTTARTFNSCGHRIWAASQSRNLSVDGRKTNTILKQIIDDAPWNYRETLWGVYHEVIAGVGLAKALGYVPEGIYPTAKRLLNRSQFHQALDEQPDDLTADLIDTVLQRSIKQAYEGHIDFNDQVYMPALFGGSYPQFPLVLVDEYQDLSPVNHALLSKLVRGRLIGVGDPWQNIYGFRGAKAGGIKEATETYQCEGLPLSISFRCPSAIVKNVHWRVPHFRWFTEGGHVEKPNRFAVDDFADDSTIICRNNAPLISCGFRLLASGRSISIAGSDIGPRLIGIMKKLGPETLGQAGVLDSIAEWEADKLEKESTTASDMAECMRIFAKQGKNLSGAMAYAKHIFEQQGSILLTTGHKAKGLEWPNVVHLDPYLVRKQPSEQNQNLDYVISTRSSDRLTEIDSEQIEW